jgi:enoyl-CoA hydratase/carnithine racemase
MSNVIQSRVGRVLRLQLSRPEKKNALTLDMYRALVAGLEEADRDPDIRCTLISGLPGVFTAGNDLKDFMNPSDLTPVANFLSVIVNTQKPVAAAVSGLAIGVGTTMLLHFDLVYAAADAQFRMPFVDLGLVPEAGSSALLPMLMGHRRASSLLLFGETLGAEDACDVGLVNRVYPDFDALEAGAMERMTTLSERAPGAVRDTKRLLKQSSRDAIAAIMAAEMEVFAKRLFSPESSEALTASMSKCKPDFSKFA